MTNDFSQLYAWLDTVEERVTRGAHTGLEKGASVLEDAAKATAAYNDQTGATRAGTVAVVISIIDDGSGKAQAAAQAAESLNPGHGQNNITISPSPDIIAVALSVGQNDYSVYRETEHAGVYAVAEPTMRQYSGQLDQFAAAGVKQEIEA